MHPNFHKLVNDFVPPSSIEATEIEEFNKDHYLRQAIRCKTKHGSIIHNWQVLNFSLDCGAFLLQGMSVQELFCQISDQWLRVCGTHHIEE